MRGPASPAYKTGRYSKDLPTQLAQRAEAARTNPRLLSLADDLALNEARIAELLGTVETGESGDAWRVTQDTVEALSDALARGDVDAMQAQFTALRQVVGAGRGRAAAWEEIRRLWETRCKLVQTEVKTLQGLQQMVTTQQLMLYLGAITAAVTDAVQAHADPPTQRKILMDIQAEFTRLSTLEAR